jgi:hypothetical protein
MRRRSVLYVAAGVLVLIVLGALGAVASDQRDEAEQARANATATPSPPVDSLRDCPWGDASCVLALGIERALQAGNIEAVIEFMAPRLFICPGGSPQGAGGPFPLCDGAEKDTGRTGLHFGRRYSEGGVTSIDGIRAILTRFLDDIDPNARDSVGEGRLRLYAFSCSTPAIRFQNVSCAREGIILSAIVGEGSSQRRELLIFWAAGGFQGRTLPVIEVWDGAILTNEVPILFQSGGTLPDLGEVYAIDQSLR